MSCSNGLGVSKLAYSGLFSLLFSVFAFSHASAGEILSTDFDDRTVSGYTASNLTWITNGVADPGDVTADTNPDGLFDTSDAQDRFAPNRNLHNEGSWSILIDLAVGGASIDLSDVTLDAFIFNNAGSEQIHERNLNLMLELLDFGLGLLDSASAYNIYINDPANTGSAVQPQTVSFDLSGNSLAANSSYFLRLTAFGEGPGNNAGIDNFVVNGAINAVPEPGTLALLGLGLVGMAARRRKTV